MKSKFENKKYIKGTGCQFYGEVDIGAKSVIGNYVILGYPKERRILKLQNTDKEGLKSLPKVDLTRIGLSCGVDSNVIIHEGTIIGNHVFIDDFCRIGYSCRIDNNSRINYGAFICDRVKIGRDCIIAGFICDGSIIENNSMVMGQLVHEYSQPQKRWGVEEFAPKISHHCVVGYGSIIVGGISIGDHSYIGAGAIVTKNVPAKSVVVGVNNIIPYHKWNGKKIAKEFWDWN